MMNDYRDHALWIEKYRPNIVDDCILPLRLKTFFNEQLANGELQNLLLIGTPGVGKTTVAKALCRQLGADVLFLNASEQGGIEILRTQIRSFASSMGFSDANHRCVILDEADYLNPSSTQPALRGFLEEFARNCRFILTANFGNRILDPIKSRCAVVDFTLSKDEKLECIVAFNKRILWILENENVSYDKVSVADVIKKFFPDYRKILNELQRSCSQGVLHVGQLSSVSEDIVKEVIGHIKARRFLDIRKWVIANSDLDFHSLVKMLFDKMLEIGVVAESLPDLILILGDYDYKRSFVMNPEIHTAGMLTRIMMDIQFKK
jgi:DNA polymerase III delta prime subunit